MRYKPEFDMDIADQKRGKVGVNGHQLTLQRIRRSLEKLKRKSGNPPQNSSTGSTSKSSGNDTEKDTTATPRSSRRTDSKSRSMSTSDAPTTPRSGRPPIKPSSSSSTSSPTATRIKSQGVSAGTSTTSGSVAAHGSSSRVQRSPVTSSTAAGASNGATDRRREYRSNRTERNRRRSYAGDENGGAGYKSPFSLHKQQMAAYKPTTTTTGGPSGAASDTECMIFYDSNASDISLTGAGAGAGSLSHLPTSGNVTSRSHVMPRHVDMTSSSQYRGAKQTMSIDKPGKVGHNRASLEDSGIDVKSPPVLSAGRTRDRVNSMGDADTYTKTPTKPQITNGGLSQDSTHFSPAFSESSPFSFVGTDANHVKRTGSFSSLKSLPVTVYKEPEDGSPYTFEPIDGNRLRSKSQSMTNLHNNKVIRRRSLPPLDVSQEKLEAKKSSLSKRLAKKISNFRQNEKRFMLPSPHQFNPQQGMQAYKSSPERHKHGVGSSDNREQRMSDKREHVGDNRSRSRDNKHVVNDDDLSDADMEVAGILEGKPEHPTDSDVEDYLACVESTDTTQSESRHGGQGESAGHTESTPYDHIEKQQVHHRHDHVDKQGHKQDYNEKQVHKHASLSEFTDLTSPRGGASMHDNHYSQQSSSDKQRTHSFSDYKSSRKYVTENNNNYSQKPLATKYDKHDVSNHHSSRDKPKDITKSMDSGIKSAYSKSHQSLSTNDKPKIPPPPPQKPKKALNKFVEQSMKSFLNDCHPGTMSETDIMDMHHAALQGSIPSPYRDKPDISQKPEIKSKPEVSSKPERTSKKPEMGPKPDFSQFTPSHTSSRNAEPRSPGAAKVSSSLDAVTLNSSKKPEDATSEYEKARARFAHLSTTSNQSNNDVFEQPQTANQHQNNASIDSTYKSKIQLTLQPAATSPPGVGLEPATSVQPDPDPTRSRRYSHPANAALSHASHDNGIMTSRDNGIITSRDNGIMTPRDVSTHDEDISGKPLTLFAIIRSHSVIAIHLEKGGCKSFGIIVKRVLFTSAGRVRDVSSNQNVVIIQEVTSQAPPGVANAVMPHDVIIEVNGHNVLQSSDKVVRTLLDARTSLEMVIGRAKPSNHQSITSKEMDIHQNATNKYQQPPETINFMNDTNSSHSRSSPLVFHNMNDIHPADLTLKSPRGQSQGQHISGSQSARSRVYEEGPMSAEGHQISFDLDTEVTNWNARSAQYDAVLNSPRFNQLSEGPTFVL